MASVTFGCIVKDGFVLSKYSKRGENFDNEEWVIKLSLEEMPEGITYERVSEKRPFYLRRFSIRKL